MGVSNVMASKINQFVDPSRKMTKPLAEVKQQEQQPQSFQDSFHQALSHPEGKGLFVDSAL